MPRDYYSPETAKKIKIFLQHNPGLKARNIAAQLGMTRRTVNSYLYSHKSNALAREVYKNSHDQWFLKASTDSRNSASNSTFSEYKESKYKVYSAEVIRDVFKRDDYQDLKEEEQGKLAEMLNSAEREQQLIEKRAQQLAEQKLSALTKSNNDWLPVIKWIATIFTCTFVMYAFFSASNEPVRQPIPLENSK